MSTSRAATPEWAEKVRVLRKKLNMNQSELAQKLNVSAMAISRWERAVNQPPAEAFISLGKLAGEPECWFFWQQAGLSKSDLKRAL